MVLTSGKFKPGTEYVIIDNTNMGKSVKRGPAFSVCVLQAE